MSRLTKNDVAWEAIFRDFPILKKVDSIGRYYITADTINVYREARLMAKFDSYHELPKIMKKNNLYIISVANGTYAITRHSPFITVPSLESKKLYPVKFMTGLATLDYYKDREITKESTALNIATYNNILSDAFGEKINLTIHDMHRASLQFKLFGMDFDVDKTQVDIDGCYEGAHAVHVIEAKVGAITNTNIRQLLYPKRMIEQTYITSNKPVNAWLLNYTGSDKIFRVYKFVDDADNFRFDIEQSKRYILK